MNTNKYSDAVLKAVNLGEDSNTTAAITGGLAGLVYGYRTIPKHWINQLARKENIEDLAKRMGKKLEETIIAKLKSTQSEIKKYAPALKTKILNPL